MKRISLTLVVLAFLVAAALYPQLPEQIPVHFDGSGTADRFVAKPVGPFVLPLIALALFAVLQIAPKRSLRGWPALAGWRGYEVAQVAAFAVLLVLTAVILLRTASIIP